MLTNATRIEKLYFFCILMLSIFFSIYISLNYSYRGHYTGDGTSNEAALKRGKKFDQIGFLKLHFVPLESDIQNINATDPLPDGLKYYTHYPPGSDILQGLLFRLGLDSVQSHYYVGIVITFIGALFAWFALVQIFSISSALIAWTVCILSPCFLFFADSLYDFPWLFLLKWFYLLQILTINSASVNYRKYGLKFFLIALLASWFSIDAIPNLLFVGLALFFILPFKNALTLFFSGCLGELVGFSLHIIKNGFALGGLKPAFLDIYHAFLHRSAQATILDPNTTYSLSKHFGKYILGMQWFFSWPVIVLACIGWMCASKKNKFALFTATALGAIFWQFFMRQHSMIHAFTQRHADMFIVLGIGYFVSQFQDKIVKFFVVLLITTHAGLSIWNIEGTGIKTYILEKLLSEPQRESVACQEQARVFHSDELLSAKYIIKKWLPQSCNADAQPRLSKIKQMSAQLILYWR